MFRRIEDFTRSWSHETAATLKIMNALTEASLAQAVVPGGRTLGRLAWHIVLTLPEMMGHTGLTVEGPSENVPQPPLGEIIRQYTSCAARVGEQVSKRWTDAMLPETIPMYGEEWTRGDTLSALIVHQIHHRAQMTVLMRQAGLAVPGLYGPAREEWAGIGLAPPA